MSTKTLAGSAAIALENLASLRGGSVLEDFAEKIAEATAAVKNTHKKAKVVLTLTIEPADKKAEIVERVWVSDDIVTKLPPPPVKDTLMHVVGKNLSARDPQQDLLNGARSVATGADEVARARALGKDAAAGEG